MQLPFYFFFFFSFFFFAVTPVVHLAVLLLAIYRLYTGGFVLHKVHVVDPPKRGARDFRGVLSRTDTNFRY